MLYILCNIKHFSFQNRPHLEGFFDLFHIVGVSYFDSLQPLGTLSARLRNGITGKTFRDMLLQRVARMFLESDIPLGDNLLTRALRVPVTLRTANDSPPRVLTFAGEACLLRVFREECAVRFTDSSFPKLENTSATKMKRQCLQKKG